MVRHGSSSHPECCHPPRSGGSIVFAWWASHCSFTVDPPLTALAEDDSLSHAFAHPSRQHSQLIAVLRHGAARDLDAALFQDVDDGLVGERMLRIFLGDELLDLRLDAAGRDVLARRGRETGREEKFEREHAARRLHELLVRHAAHRRFVHVDHLGHFAKRERLEVLHALLEEVALPVDDVVHDFEHRLTALLDRLNHPVRGVQFVGDELLALALELLLVARDLLIRATQLEARQVRVVEEDVVLAVDLLDDEVGDDVVVAGVRIDETGLRIELLDLVGGLLDVGRADAKALGDLTPAVVDQLVETVAHEAERHRLLESRLAELEHETLTQIARADARRIEALNGPEHLVDFGRRVDRQILGISLEGFGGLDDRVVDRREDVLDRAGEVAVLVDVADELVGEERLARAEVEQRDLVGQMIGEIARIDRDRLVVLAIFVLFAAAAGVESVEKDLFPIDLIVGGLFFSRLLFFSYLFFLGLLLILLRLDHVEEGVVQQLLLEVLLKVQERHVEQVHRLVEAWIDLELLLELRALGKTSFHEATGSPGSASAAAKRARNRAVNVGPR